MYGPAMAQPCPSCTSILDGLDGQVHHIGQRVAIAAVARSPINRVRAVARERGWWRLRLLSSATNSYHRDCHGEDTVMLTYTMPLATAGEPVITGKEFEVSGCIFQSNPPVVALI